MGIKGDKHGESRGWGKNSLLENCLGLVVRSQSLWLCDIVSRIYVCVKKEKEKNGRESWLEFWRDERHKFESMGRGSDSYLWIRSG